MWYHWIFQMEGDSLRCHVKLEAQNNPLSWCFAKINVTHLQYLQNLTIFCHFRVQQLCLDVIKFKIWAHLYIIGPSMTMEHYKNIKHSYQTTVLFFLFWWIFTSCWPKQTVWFTQRRMCQSCNILRKIFLKLQYLDNVF